MSKLRVGGLFSGIGGFELGFERAGMEIAWMVEIDPFCRAVLTKHWPDVPKYEDVRDVGKQNLETVDVIAGGFPCQPHSLAGKRKGERDDRNLWPEFKRVIDELRPRWVVAENVPGIIYTYLDTVLSDLEGAGYAAGTLNLPACAFDAPHRRERIFIVAHTEGERGREHGRATYGSPSPVGRQINQRWSAQPPNEFASNGEGGRAGHVAYADGSRRTQQRWAKPARAKHKTAERGSKWRAEPNVGRVVTRVSSALDGTLRRFGYEDVNDTQAFAEIDRFRGGILRAMWHENREAEPPSYREEGRCSNDSMYQVSCLRAHERWNLGQRIEKDEELRDMWQGICAKPLEETQDLQQEMLKRIRAQERNEAVASSRVDRLRALGNAVVPQVAEFVGRQIVATEALL